MRRCMQQGITENVTFSLGSSMLKNYPITGKARKA